MTFHHHKILTYSWENERWISLMLSDSFQKRGPYSAMKRSWQFSQWVWNSCTQQKMACSPLYKATFLHNPNATTLRCRINDTAKSASTEMRCWMCAITTVDGKCGNIQCLLQKQRMTRKKKKWFRAKQIFELTWTCMGSDFPFSQQEIEREVKCSLRKGNVLSCGSNVLHPFCSSVFLG